MKQVVDKFKVILGNFVLNCFQRSIKGSIPKLQKALKENDTYFTISDTYFDSDCEYSTL